MVRDNELELTEVEKFALREEINSLEVDTDAIVDKVVDEIAGHTLDPEDVRQQLPVDETKAAIDTVIDGLGVTDVARWERVEITDTTTVAFFSCGDRGAWFDPIRETLPDSDDVRDDLPRIIFHQTASAITDDQLTTYDKQELDGRGEFALKLTVGLDTYGRYLADYTRLSDQEAQVEARLQADLSTQEIVDELDMNESSVGTVKQRIQSKAIKARNTAELVSR